MSVPETFTGNWARLGLAFLACAILAGCGGPTRLSIVKAGGTVYLDGKPHGPATVTLNPVKSGEDDTRPVISGDVDSSGKFALTTYDKGDGAPAGSYTASLSGSASDAGSTDPAIMMNMMGGGGKTAPLTVEIPASGSDSLEFKFTSSKGGAAPKPNAPLGAAPAP